MNTFSDSLLTVVDMAEVLKVQPSTVRSWVKQDIIPRNTYIHVGTTYRFDKEAVVKALKQNTTTDSDQLTSSESHPVQLELDFGDTGDNTDG